MARRQLPPRSTRGQRPAHSQDPKDDEVYQTIFGLNLDDPQDPDFIRKLKENQKKNTFALNIHRYSYGRAYHYFYDLNQFQRLPQHPSYAIDPDNIFQNTFSQENQPILDSRVGDLVNRKYFGLPITENEERSRETRTKNVCHAYLFENQDKKYNLDRILLTCKIVLSTQQKGKKIVPFKEFGVFKRDAELVQLLDPSLTDAEKTQILAKKIKVLEERKENNRSNLQIEDQNYFYHSLNQILHNSINSLKKQVSLQGLAVELIQKSNLTNLGLDGVVSESGVNNFLKERLKYYGSEEVAISEEELSKLTVCLEQLVRRSVESETRLLFPIEIVHLGSKALQQTLNSVLAIKFNTTNETVFLLARALFKKCFNTELTLQKEEKFIPSDHFIKTARKQIDQLKKFYKNYNRFQQNRASLLNYPALDSIINSKGLDSVEGSSQKVPIFQEQNLVELSGREYLCIMIYNWVCISFADIFEFVQSNEEAIDFLGSEYYPKYMNCVVEAVGTVEFGLFSFAIDLLCDHLVKPDPLSQLNFRLYLQYVPLSNTILIWKKEKEEENWETEKQSSEEIEESQENSQGQKKCKSN